MGDELLKYQVLVTITKKVIVTNTIILYLRYSLKELIDSWHILGRGNSHLICQKEKTGTKWDFAGEEGEGKREREGNI